MPARHVPRWCGASVDARRVDEDVDGAEGAGELLDRRLVTDVDLMVQTLGARRDVRRVDLVPAGSKSVGDRSADAARAARDQGDSLRGRRVFARSRWFDFPEYCNTGSQSGPSPRLKHAVPSGGDAWLSSI